MTIIISINSDFMRYRCSTYKTREGLVMQNDWKVNMPIHCWSFLILLFEQLAKFETYGENQTRFLLRHLTKTTVEMWAIVKMRYFIDLFKSMLVESKLVLGSGIIFTNKLYIIFILLELSLKYTDKYFSDLVLGHNNQSIKPH